MTTDILLDQYILNFRLVENCHREHSEPVLERCDQVFVVSTRSKQTASYIKKKKKLLSFYYDNNNFKVFF